jgi:hypothetical protein
MIRGLNLSGTSACRGTPLLYIGFMQVLKSFKSQYYKIFKTLKLSYLQQNGLKSLCCYNSHEVSLCGGGIYNPYVDATVVPDCAFVVQSTK